MDKPIIIDGVDVSKCAHYDKNADKEAPFLYDCKREHAPCWSCASMPNCLYKNYKRKEQECEELKEQLTILDDEDVVVEITIKQFEEYKKLKAENEILKQYKASKQASYESMQREWNQAVNENRELKAENEELKDKNNRLTILGMDLNQSNEVLRKSFFQTDKSRDKWREQAEKYSKALAEIKEIAETAAKCLYATKSDDYTDGYRWLGSIILQKIRECEANVR